MDNNNSYTEETLQDRERILRQFETLLDRVLQDEQPPVGIPQEIWQELHDEDIDDQRLQQTDLYAMWSVLTSLAQESKLQARGFKQLQEAVQAGSEPLRQSASEHEQPGAIVRALDRLQEEMTKLRQQQHQQQTDLEDKASADFIDLLIDIRERLRRGLQASREHFERADQHGHGLLGLWRRNDQHMKDYRDALWSLLEGYTLNLEHLENVLEKMELREIDCLGQPFDPQTMVAVELDAAGHADDGVVLDVYVAGYAWRGKLFRPARVKVARKSIPQAPER